MSKKSIIDKNVKKVLAYAKSLIGIGRGHVSKQKMVHIGLLMVFLHQIP